MRNTTGRFVSAALLAVALVGTGTGAAHAQGGSDAKEVRVYGHCTGYSQWGLKVKKDDGALEVEFEVDSNKVGQAWSVAMYNMGARFFYGTGRTVAPSGSFEISRRTTNLAGYDHLTAGATNPVTGEKCVASMYYGY